MNLLPRTLYDEDHEQFREVVRRFVDDEVLPHYDQWEQDGIVSRDVWIEAGKRGLVCPDGPAEFGGGGAPDWRFNAVINEVFGELGVPGFALPLHNDVVVPYVTRFGTEDQQQRWLPGMVRGELIGAIAMTEPGTGSDLASIATTADDHPDGWVLNGAKTFTSNGHLADMVIVVARTGAERPHDALSLLVVERDMPGFTRGRNLKKVGMHAQDTAELHFDDVLVPRENLLGVKGGAFRHLMEGLTQERLVVGVGGLANAKAVVDQTMAYVQERTAFGQPIGTFQVNRHTLADLHTRIQMAEVFLDRCLELHLRDELDAVTAAMVKYRISDLQVEVIDACVQLHGGYGYMEEYPVARAYRDARAQRIYAGTNEIMKDLIGRSLGL